MGMSPVEHERRMHLSNLLRMVGAKDICTYDFGYRWEYGIMLEKHLPALTHSLSGPARAENVPVGLKGCGGIGGFYYLLDALPDPIHEQQ